MTSFDLYDSISEVDWDWDKDNLTKEQSMLIKKNYLLRLYAFKCRPDFNSCSGEMKEDVKEYRYAILSSIYYSECVSIPKATIELAREIPKLGVYGR